MTNKVLIVDDEPHIRMLLEQTLDPLEEVGVEILLAENGKRALQLFFAEHPTVVLLDLMLPEIDGFEVCKRIRERAADTYIVMLTAKGQELDRQTGASVGANKFMTKPFDPDELLRAVTEALHREP